MLIDARVSPSLSRHSNMADPPQFEDPDRIGSSYYYCGTDDNGGVHYNSGVNNKAAYLMTDGGTFNGQTVTGIGISQVADVYYQAQTAYLNQSSGWLVLDTALRDSCDDLVGTGGITAASCATVAGALDAVEMNQGNECVGPPAPRPPYCPVGEAMQGVPATSPRARSRSTATTAAT